MREEDRIQYDQEIAYAQQQLDAKERSLQDAMRSGLSPQGVESFRRSIDEYRSKLAQAIGRKNSDYYGRHGD